MLWLIAICHHIERFDKKDDLIETRKNFIEGEILIRVEQIRQHLNELEQELLDSLNNEIAKMNENFIEYEEQIKE